MNKTLMSQLLKYRRELFGFIRAMVHNSSDADDIFQDVAMVIMERPEGVEDIRNFQAWSFEIARRKIQEFFRKEKGKKEVAAPTDEMEELITEVYTQYSLSDTDRQEEYDALRKCMEKVRVKHKKLIKLRFIEDRSYKEIAKIAKKSSDVIRQAVSRVRRALASCIERTLKTSEAESCNE